MTTAADIKAIVAERCGVPVARLDGPGRDADTCLARAVAVMSVRDILGLSLIHI